MGKLISAAPISAWWFLLVWPFLLAAITVFYRGEWRGLPGAGKMALLALRCLAATLLLLCLVQPVWETEYEKTEPRVVPIFVDNSLSMWYPDPQRGGAEKVRLAEKIEFLAPEHRFKFEPFFGRSLTNARSALDEFPIEDLSFDLKSPRPSSSGPSSSEASSSGLKKDDPSAEEKAEEKEEEKEEAKEEEKTAEEMLEEKIDALEERLDAFIDLADILEDMMEDLQHPKANLAHLADELRQEAASAMLTVVTRAKTLEENWKDLEKKKKELEEDEQTVTGRDYQLLTVSISEGRDEVVEFLDEIEDYQFRADTLLSESDEPEVVEAMDKMENLPRMDLVLHIMEKIKRPVLPLLLRKNENSPIFAFGHAEEIDKAKQFNSDGLKRVRAPKTDFPAEFARLFSFIGEDEEMQQLVLISDGRDHSGAVETELVELLKQKQLKVVGLGVGSTEPIPDAAIINSELPSRVFHGDTVKLKLKLKLVGEHAGPVKIRLMSDDKEVLTKVLPKDPERDELGRFDYTIEFKVDADKQPDRVELVSDDKLPENNGRSLEFWVRKEHIRALFLDEFPRWESRYLNMMLRRDKRMDLKNMRVIFTGSLKDQKLKRGNSYRDFPADKESLFNFDLIILGDVSPDIFTDDEKNSLVSFVKDNGGTLIFLAGRNYMPNAYYGTSLEPLLPVERVRRTAVGLSGFQPSLTQEGEAIDYMEEYKGKTDDVGHGKLHWVRSDVSSAPTATVLAEVSSTDLPLVVTSYFGPGKLLYLGSDEFWRWRFREGWKHHHDFWSLILLWATSEKIEGENRFVKLHMAKRRFSTADNPEIKIKLVGKNGKPLEGSLGLIHLIGQDEDGEKIDKKLPYRSVDVGGSYRVELGQLPPGDYRIEPKVDELTGEETDVVLSFEIIEESSQETLYIRQNQSFLKRLCEETGGQYFDFGEYDKLIEAVHKDIREIKRTEQNELWDTWWMIFAVTILLVIEWCLRKRFNLI